MCTACTVALPVAGATQSGTGIFVARVCCSRRLDHNIPLPLTAVVAAPETMHRLNKAGQAVDKAPLDTDQ